MTDARATNLKEKPKLSENAGFSWFAFDVIEFQTSPVIQGMSAAERGVWVTLSAIQWHDNYLPKAEQLLSKRTGFEVRLLCRWLEKYGDLFPICPTNPQYRANPKLLNLAVTVGKIATPEPVKETTDTKQNESQTTTVPPSAGSCSNALHPSGDDLNGGKDAGTAKSIDNHPVPAPSSRGESKPFNPRFWDREVGGISAERIRACVMCQLDYRRNRYYISNITEESLGRDGFVRKLDRDTPEGWSPAKDNEPQAKALPAELSAWANEMEEYANER